MPAAAPPLGTRSPSSQGLINRARRYLRHLSPRRFVIITGLALLKVSILIWALPHLKPKGWTRRRPVLSKVFPSFSPGLEHARGSQQGNQLALLHGDGKLRKAGGASPNGTASILSTGLINNEVVWRDTAGNAIQAHGGSVLYHEGVFYWYGEHKGGPTLLPGTGNPPSIVHRVDVIGVSCYTSTDLIHWHFEGLALKAGQHADLAPSKVVERPRVLYNEASRAFVMWVHVDEADYELARMGVATSARPEGPYVYHGSFRPHGQMARDFTLFKDDDGTAYIAYSSEKNRVMHVARLTDDYKGVVNQYLRTMIGMSREAPAMFKHGGVYFMLTSACTGWNPNRAEVFYASTPLSGWESLGDPCIGGTLMARSRTFFAQGTHVLPLPGRPGEFLFMADRWIPTDLGKSRYIWLPMWVRDAGKPGARDIAALQQRVRRRRRFRHMRAGAAAALLNSTLPPVDVVVRWSPEWDVSALEKPPPQCTNIVAGHFETLFADTECVM